MLIPAARQAPHFKAPPPVPATDNLPAPPLPPSTVLVSTPKGMVHRLAPIREGSLRSSASNAGEVDVEEVSTADMTHISDSVLQDLPDSRSVVSSTHHHMLSFERMADWESAYRPVSPLNTANDGVFAFSESPSVVFVNAIGHLLGGEARVKGVNTFRDTHFRRKRYLTLGYAFR